jgi:hypothetical protein
MSLSSLSSVHIRRFVKLVKEREKIQAQLAQVERSLDAFEGGKVPKVKSATKKPRRRRGKPMKEALLKKLQSAGKAGITVKELAASIKAKPASVAVWIYTTGKKIKGIKKVGPGRFAFVG